MKVKQATHVRPDNAGLLTICPAVHGGFLVTVNGIWGEMDYRNTPMTGAAFSTAEECGAWVLGVLQNTTHKQFGPRAKETK